MQINLLTIGKTPETENFSASGVSLTRKIHFKRFAVGADPCVRLEIMGKHGGLPLRLDNKIN